jgi:hypothetical protein
MVILIEKVMDGCFGIYGEQAVSLIEGRTNKNNYPEKLIKGMLTLGRYLRQDQRLKLKEWSIPKEVVDYVGITRKDIELDIVYDTPKETEVSKLTEDTEQERVLLTSRSNRDVSTIPSVVTTKRPRDTKSPDEIEPATKRPLIDENRRTIEDEDKDTEEEEETATNFKTRGEDVPRVDVEAIDGELKITLNQAQRKELRRHVKRWMAGIGKGDNGDTTPEGIESFRQFKRQASVFNNIEYREGNEDVLWVITQLDLLMDTNEFIQCLNSKEIEVPRGAPWENSMEPSSTSYMQIPPNEWFKPFQCAAVREVLLQYTVEEAVTQQSLIMTCIKNVVPGAGVLQIGMFLHFMISTHIPNYKYVFEMIARDEYETPTGYIHAHFEGNTPTMINDEFPFKLR